MNLRPPDDPVARERRKRDLLLASELARGQAVIAMGQIDARVDRIVRGLLWVRAWAAQRQVWIAGGTLASALALFALPRLRSLRLLRWGLLAGRAWRAWRVSRARLGARG